MFDGYVMKKAIEVSSIGGDFISEQVKAYLDSVGIDTTPQYLIKGKSSVDPTKPPNYQKKSLTGVTKSFHDVSTMVLYIYKANDSRV